MGNLETQPLLIRRTRVLIAMIAMLSAAGCQKPLDVADYRQTVESARHSIPVAVEMETLFGNASHGITNYGRGFPADSQVWRTEAYFGNRYAVHMQVDVQVNYDANTVQTVGEPTFGIVEFKEIKFLPDGRGDVRSGENKLFSLAEWQRLYESGGDLSVIGLRVNSNPTPGFERFVADIRANELNISLLDHKVQPNSKK
jgi:hypothetical protein